MALANISYSLNHTEDTAYMVIKNDPEMLEKLFQGLFIVARRHLGYHPNASSYPFMTRAASASSLRNSKHEKQDLEHGMKNSIVITPDTEKHGKYEVMTITASGHTDFLEKAIDAANDMADPEDALSYMEMKNTPVYMALIEDYWDDMLAFAKENRFYARNWQSFAPTV